jgi:hypothetical protein
MSDDTEGVVLGDGRCRVVLHAADRIACDGFFEHRVDIVAGPFHGALTAVAYANDHRDFREQVIELHRTLSGAARRGGYENLEMTFIGDGLGHIEVEIAAIAEHVPPIRLSFGMLLDQTQLPGIIAAIERTFLQGAAS